MDVSTIKGVLVMNEKEAREIVETGRGMVLHRRTNLPVDGFDLAYARGYLEAIEKANPIVEAVKFYLTPHNPNLCSCGSCDDKFKSVLAEWEEEK